MIGCGNESPHKGHNGCCTRLRVVEEENHRLVLHARLHETQLEVLVPFHRAIVLRDFNLIRQMKTWQLGY